MDCGSEIADKKQHVDLFVHCRAEDGGMVLVRVDLKDPDRTDTGNFTLSSSEVEYFRAYREEAPWYMLAVACRLDGGLQPKYSRFRLFKALDVVSYIDEWSLVPSAKNSDGYYLISVADLSWRRQFFDVVAV